MPKNKDTENMKKVKTFPNNLEAEQSLLCCILIDGNVSGSVIPMLMPEAFYNAQNRKIFAAMKELNAGDKAIDIITVNDQLTRMRQADENTLEYLTDLVNMLPSGANYRQYYNIIKRDYVLRMIIERCNSIIEKAYSGEDDKEVLDYAEKLIFDISKNERYQDLIHISEPATAVIDRLNAIAKDKNAFRGLMTGMPLFDKLTNGLQKGDLIILAARPSVGKTAFALNMAANIAKNTEAPKTILIFSLEMPAVQLTQRILCNVSNVSMDEINKGELIADGKTQLWKAVRSVSNTKIYINDSSIVSPENIMSQCRRMASNKEKNIDKIDLIIVDYLQLMESGKKNADNRQVEVADMSRNMKIIAKELQCPLVLLSQMSRGIESRTEKAPLLSDLRESGAIEQDADIVMFLSREDEKDKKNSPVILTVAKHRNGDLDSIRLVWDGAHQRFTEHSDQNMYIPKNNTKQQKQEKEEQNNQE